MSNPLIKKNTAVVVLGLGVTGISAVKYFASLGAKVMVSEVRHEGDITPSEKKVLAEYCTDYETGGHTSTFLCKAEFIFKSPGIPANMELLVQAERDGVKIVGELEVVAAVLQSQIIAITGTNGKTTVTTLIGELLQKSGKEVFVGGNIGRPLFDCLMSSVHPEYVVIEVSSFQLENMGTFRPHIGVILNITPDHLDRHASFGDYIEAKARLFANQQTGDKAILCADDVICMELADNLTGKNISLFGHSKDCMAYICESEIILKMDGAVEQYNLEETAFNNHTGLLNCAAAILVARYAECDHASITAGLDAIKPLPHRMEIVDEFDGLTFCNDSKATNTGAVISALTQVKGEVVLIAGGKDKGDDYALLKDSLRQKVRRMVLIGEAASLIAHQLEGSIPLEFASSMEDAVRKASSHAKPGDTILLSPACASFDMFESYGHRGEMFKECVNKLKSSRGYAVSATGQKFRYV